MSAKSYRRKDLKHDEFVSKTTRATRWVMQHRRRIGWVLLVVIVVASVLAGVWTYRAGQEQRAATQLAVALQIYRAPVDVAPTERPDGGDAAEAPSTGTPAAAATDPADAGAGLTETGPEAPAPAPSTAAPSDEHTATDHRHFRSDRARLQAAKEALEPVVSEYGGYPSGKIAAYYLGLVHAELGETDEALAALQRAADSSKPLVVAMARYRLGMLYLEAGRAAEAVETFERLAAGGSAFPAPEALMAKGKAHEAAGEPREALTAYRRIVDEHAGSAYVADARARADELAARLGLDPAVESS